MNHNGENIYMGLSYNRKVTNKNRELYSGHLHWECSSDGPGSTAVFGTCPTVLLNNTTREPSLKVSTESYVSVQLYF